MKKEHTHTQTYRPIHTDLGQPHYLMPVAPKRHKMCVK